MAYLDEHLAELAQTDLLARRAALEALLTGEGLDFTVQECAADEKRKAARNYLLLPPGDGPCPLLCAHYDAHPGSVGANDNAAALCILVALAKTLRGRGVQAAFAFLDGEESGHSGAKLLESQRDWEASVVVNLDMCGYGDTLTVYARGSQKKPAARPFCDKARLESHHGKLVKYLPESDDVCFSTRRQPVLSVAVMPTLAWGISVISTVS